jgi:hypothetical protein
MNKIGKYKLHELEPSQTIIRLKKSKRIRWVNTYHSRGSGKFMQDFKKRERSGTLWRSKNKWEDYIEMGLK